MQLNGNITSSFRDPSGFIFTQDGHIYRQVNHIYKEHYDHLLNSGLYTALVDAHLLVPHHESDAQPPEPENVYKVIQPKVVPFISYPYEWSFSQLKDAAITTLQIQLKSLDYGMSLKDCSAYNIQFNQGKPIFIDTLSFEKYREGEPWVAYRQFCQHFLAPLALMSYTDVRLNQLLRVYIDGIPLDLVSFLLPSMSWLRFATLFHIHLHAKTQKRFSLRPRPRKTPNVSRSSFLALIENLISGIERLKWTANGTDWGDYYESTCYSDNGFSNKKRLVEEFLEKTNPRMVWDLGSNTGLFSRIAAARGIQTICFDLDPGCVEKNYLYCSKNQESNILPLVLDITNPSPNIGWQNQERMSLVDRGPADVVLALALIHHLCISNNVPLKKIAAFFHEITHALIIEFVPPGDTQVQSLLSGNGNLIRNYSQGEFENAFSQYFYTSNQARLDTSGRSLYQMHRK